MVQAVKAGFPQDLIQDDDITFFDGVVVHLAQMPTGGKKKDGTPVTRPLPTQFKLDGGKKKGKGKGKK